MIWVALLIAVVLVGFAVAGIIGRIDGSLAEPTATVSFLPLPQDRLTEEDVDAVRFDTAFRGYRMDQVDEVMARLRTEIRLLGGAVPRSRALVTEAPTGEGAQPHALEGLGAAADDDGLPTSSAAAHPS